MTPADSAEEPGEWEQFCLDAVQQNDLSLLGPLFKRLGDRDRSRGRCECVLFAIHQLLFAAPLGTAWVDEDGSAIATLISLMLEGDAPLETARVLSFLEPPDAEGIRPQRRFIGGSGLV